MKVRECVLIVVGPHLIAPSILAGLSCVSKVDYVHCLSVSVINKLSDNRQRTLRIFQQRGH